MCYYDIAYLNVCGRGIMVARQLPKLKTRVRFSSPAPPVFASAKPRLADLSVQNEVPRMLYRQQTGKILLVCLCARIPFVGLIFVLDEIHLVFNLFFMLQFFGNKEGTKHKCLEKCEILRMHAHRQLLSWENRVFLNWSFLFCFY